MGNKLYVIFEYLYIAMAIFSVYLVVANWETDRSRAYLFMIFTVVAIFMFFFKRKFRQKMEDRNKQD